VNQLAGRTSAHPLPRVIPPWCLRFPGFDADAYRGAVQDALAGVEEARVVLAGVVRRIEG
jgi:hypothetical protein